MLTKYSNSFSPSHLPSPPSPLPSPLQLQSQHLKQPSSPSPEFMLFDWMFPRSCIYIVRWNGAEEMTVCWLLFCRGEKTRIFNKCKTRSTYNLASCNMRTYIRKVGRYVAQPKRNSLLVNSTPLTSHSWVNLKSPKPPLFPDTLNSPFNLDTPTLNQQSPPSFVLFFCFRNKKQGVRVVTEWDEYMKSVVKCKNWWEKES